MTIALMMVFTTFGLIILSINYKTEWSRFLAGLLFIGALETFANSFDDYMIPLIQNHYTLSSSTLTDLRWWSALITQFSEHAAVFFYAMYCISYSRLLKKKMKLFITILFFGVTVLSFFSFPIIAPVDREIQGTYTHYYLILSIWGVPMIFFGLALSFLSYLGEKNPGIKKQKQTNLIVNTPIAVSITINLLILRAMGSSHTLQINKFIILISCFSFMIFIFKNGALGIRIKFERLDNSSTLESIARGTAILNHTLKNEVNKIAMSTDNIISILNHSDPDIIRAKENTQILENSASHLKKMIRKLYDFSSDIRLREANCFFPDLLDRAVLNLKLYLDMKRIKVIKNYKYDIHILCDADHMVEALTNILKNSCEAMSEDGSIQIDLYGSQKLLYLSITDNGKGVKKRIPFTYIRPLLHNKTW